jgi:ATP-binding cassette subfamily F protein uup
MALISLQNVSMRFGGPAVLDGINLRISRGERICLLGRNGEGKSTLMKLISGELSPDAGEILRQTGLRVGYLPQDIPAALEGTVFEAVSEPSDRATAQTPGTAEGAWRQQHLAERMIEQLGLDATARCEQLSGGLVRRLLLARALAGEPDLLVLDEPTNHLDIATIDWLETSLLRWSGALLFVTHDRMLLRKLATRIVELDRGRLSDWSCDYDTFLERKQAMLDAEAASWTQFDKQLAQEEAWVRGGIRARRTRNEGRVRALQRLREIRQARRQQTGMARMQIQEAERSGKLVIEAQDVSFGYGDQPLIQNLSTTILRGDRVGILGPNGSGKTTLLRLLLKELEPQQGRVRLGTRLDIAYFDQLREQLQGDSTVQDNVADGADTVVVDGKSRHVLSYLQDFLFTPERARSPVRILSGGERNRLLLARLFAKPSNLLILDEPTNDLDAETLELLEELLLEYRGTVLLVSHDRALLDNVVTSTLVLEGHGRVGEYVGGYSDWLRQRPSPSSEAAKASAKSATPQRQPNRQRKLSNKEQRELDALPQRIEALEAEQARLYAAMADPRLYRQDSREIVKLKEQVAEVESALEAAYARWEALEALVR